MNISLDDSQEQNQDIDEDSQVDGFKNMNSLYSLIENEINNYEDANILLKTFTISSNQELLKQIIANEI